MSIRAYERPRRHQFELRHLYRPKSTPERLRKWLSRIGQFTLSVVHLCGFGYVLLLTVALGSGGHAHEPPPKPLPDYHLAAEMIPVRDSGGWEAVAEMIPIHVSDGWEAVIVENPGR
jgi:hypothetical protein